MHGVEMIAEAARVFQHVWTWWRDELARCFPVLMRKSKQLDVEFDSGGGRIIDLNGNEKVEIGLFRDGAWLERDTGAGERLEKALKAGIGLRAIVPPALVLRQQVTLPWAAQKNFDQALSYQIPRISPFQAAEVWYAAHIEARDRAAKTIAVNVVLTPVARLKALEQSAPDAVRAPQRLVWHAPFNGRLTPFSQSVPVSAKSGFRRQLSLALIALCLGSWLLAQPYWRRTQTLERLTERATDLQPQANQATQTRLRRDKIVNVAALVDAQKRAQPSPLLFLKALSEALDDGVWLTDYRSDGKLVTFGGFAADASTTLAKIKALDGVSEARFANAIVRDQATNFDRFTVTLKMRTPR